MPSAVSLDRYNALMRQLVACRNKDEIVDALHVNRQLVDGVFISFFLEPALIPGTTRQLGGLQKMQLVTGLVQEQATRNVVDLYRNVPLEIAREFISSNRQILFLEYSQTYLAQLINYYEGNSPQYEQVVGRTRLLFDELLDYMLHENDRKALILAMHRGPGWFTNSIITDRLLQFAEGDGDFKFKSIDLLNEIILFQNRLPEEQVRNQELQQLINSFPKTKGLEQRIALLKKALSLLKNETQEVIANIQFLTAVFYNERIEGVAAANIERAEELFSKALVFFSKERYLYKWASIQNGLGRCYVSSQKGDPGDNIERGIQFFRDSLEGFTKETSGYEWALSHNNLGAAYLERIKGDKADNIKKAISHFEQALLIQTPEFVPDNWAMTMTNLGNAFNNKQAVNRKESAEKAIGYFNLALTVHSRERNPYEWASLQTRIADAYCTMAAFSMAETVEIALDHVQAALTILDSAEHPKEWSHAQWVLAQAYNQRIKGERVENLELALMATNKYFTVHTRENASYSWAMNQVNLANLYRQRLKGDAIDNQEKAIAHLENALSVLDGNKFPADNAMAYHILGLIYHDRIKDKKADNYEKAITCFENALQYRKPDKVLSSWGETVNGLGNAYKNRIYGEKADNLEKAIDYFQQAIKYIKAENQQHLWAVLQYNLGLVYAARIKGVLSENSKEAIRLFTNALSIQTPEGNPGECFKIASNMGSVYYAGKNYAEAKKAFELGHQAIENIRTQSARENTRKQIGAECSLMYAKLVYSCIALNDTDSAYYYVATAKSRVFSDKLGVQPEQPVKMLHDRAGFADGWNVVSELRQEIDNLSSQREFFYVNHSTEVLKENSLIATIYKKRKQLRELLSEMYYKFPQLSQLSYTSVPDAAKIKSLSMRMGNIPLVEYYEHSEGWGAFIVYNDKIVYTDLPGVTYESIMPVIQCIFDYEKGVLAGNNADIYSENLLIQLASFYLLLWQSLNTFLPSEGPIVIAPARDLNLLPFNIAFNKEKNNYLADTYTITYMPSLGALYNLYEQVNAKQTVKQNTLLSVVYSAKDINKPLPNAILEAGIISQYFLSPPQSIYLHEEKATPSSVLKACAQQQFDTIHFSCHGFFDFNDPDNSGLLLNKGFLTVERIQTEMWLKGYPDVILSACQTGRSRPEEGDEAVGLMQSFFSAGAGSVISSQWSVEEQSTMEIFVVFFENCKKMGPADALKQAMHAIRKQPRWKQPFFWGAFKITGLPV